MEAMSEALTKVEAGTLQAFEAVIEKGLASFVEVGNALMRIRDSRLYRGTHGTFEDYCEQRWHLKRTYVFNVIESAKAVQNVRNCEQDPPILPANEAQARPLTLLDSPKEQVAAWKEVVKTAPKDDDGEPIITAKHVESVVRERLEEDEPKPKRSAKANRPSASVAVWRDVAAHLADAEAKFSANCQECDEASDFVDSLSECRNKLTYYVRIMES